MNETLFLYAIISFILIISIRSYYTSPNYNLKCIISDVNGNKYCVRDRNVVKTKKAADLLATIVQKCKTLIDYLNKHYPTMDEVQRLVSGFNADNISETLPTSELTAYSENKGEKMAFCLNGSSSKEGMHPKLIDINTLTFVALHELSHIMTVSIGHKDEFWSNFKFLLVNAKKCGVYNPVDYKKSPQQYCGMTISDNPYYDL